MIKRQKFVYFYTFKVIFVPNNYIFKIIFVDGHSCKYFLDCHLKRISQKEMTKRKVMYTFTPKNVIMIRAGGSMGPMGAPIEIFGIFFILKF